VTRDPALLAECDALRSEIERHPTIARLRGAPDWPALEQRFGRLLGTLRRFEPPSAPGPPLDPTRVRAVHWNIEHGNWYEQVEGALTSHPELRDADLLMFNEIDLGMARAGNRDVAGDLAAKLGFHGVWAPLYLESTLGRDDDIRMAGGATNQEGLFGIAVLSRWPLGAIRLVELPSPDEIQYDVERMYGRLAGLVVEIQRPGAPFVAVSTHLEVHRTRIDRARQMKVLLQALHEETRPIVLAGDFNSHTFDRGLWHAPLMAAAALLITPGASLRRRFRQPDRGLTREFLFDELKREGFEWQPYVDYAPTLQVRFERLDEVDRLFGPFRGLAHRALRWAERRALLRLDWFAGRGWKHGRGWTPHGLDGPGKASDHAPIGAEFG
jgi:endonuclease/exonuclease/phosphatase family metal-dependent hydrolase